IASHSRYYEAAVGACPASEWAPVSKRKFACRASSYSGLVATFELMSPNRTRADCGGAYNAPPDTALQAIPCDPGTPPGGPSEHPPPDADPPGRKGAHCHRRSTCSGDNPRQPGRSMAGG